MADDPSFPGQNALELATVYDEDRGSGPSVFSFGRFQLKPEERLLSHDGCAVELGGRAFDLLHLLLRARGKVVTKEDIFEQVWPSITVDESNIRFQMACLRRALGEHRDIIKTVKGRGYILTSVNGLPRPARHFRTEGFETPLIRHETASVTAPREDGSEGAPLIAVIDDDDGIREALEGLLRATGFCVETFPSVQDFVESGRQSAAHCLILDVWMPGRSGLDFQEDLARQGINIPVIFMSGYADVPMSVRAMKAGAVEFLTKPMRHQDLLNAVKQVTMH